MMFVAVFMCMMLVVLGSSEFSDIGIGLGSRTYSMEVSEAIIKCEQSLSCAGLRYQHDEYENKTMISYSSYASIIQSHAVLPVSNDQDWDTFESSKLFTYHAGQMMVPEEDVLKVEFNWTLDMAQSYCSNHLKCIGFTFPLYSEHLTQIRNVTFISEWTSDASYFQVGELPEWSSYLINIPQRTEHRVSPDADPFDKQPLPYMLHAYRT